MTKEIWVQATPLDGASRKVPLEGAPRRYIVEGDAPVKVPLSYYYRRRIDKKELVQVEGPQQ